MDVNQIRIWFGELPSIVGVRFHIELDSRRRPSKLELRIEVGKSSSCHLLLTNITGESVEFKVMCTNPYGYIVRPKAATLPAGATCDVEVTMHALISTPPAMRCIDKFMIESLATDTSGEAPGDLEVKRVRLPVSYVVPAPARHSLSGSNSSSLYEDAPLSFSSEKPPEA